MNLASFFKKNKDKLLLAIAIAIFAISSFIFFGQMPKINQNMLNQSKNNDYPIAQIIQISEDVRFKESDDILWSSAKKNLDLKNGDGVYVGKKSKAQIDLKSGEKLDIVAESLIIFNSAVGEKNEVGKLHINLKRGGFGGKLLAGTNFFLNGRKISVKKDAVIEVKQKELTNKDGNQESEQFIKVIDGVVEVKSVSGNEVAVVSESQTVAMSSAIENKNDEMLIKVNDKSAQLPETDIILSQGGDSLKAPINLTLDKPEIYFLPNKKETAYYTYDSFYKGGKKEIEISRYADFREINSRYEVFENEFEFLPQESGFYYARIREVQSKLFSEWVSFGLLKSIQPKTISLKDLSGPLSKTKIKKDKLVEFSWNPITDAEKYILIISNQSDLSEARYYTVNEPKKSVKLFPFKEYFWAVAYIKTERQPTYVQDIKTESALMNVAKVETLMSQNIFEANIGANNINLSQSGASTVNIDTNLVELNSNLSYSRLLGSDMNFKLSFSSTQFVKNSKKSESIFGLGLFLERNFLNNGRFDYLFGIGVEQRATPIIDNLNEEKIYVLNENYFYPKLSVKYLLNDSQGYIFRLFAKQRLGGPSTWYTQTEFVYQLKTLNENYEAGFKYYSQKEQIELPAGPINTYQGLLGRSVTNLGFLFSYNFDF